MALPVARFAAAVRARNPLIHSITNYVVAPFQANALSALGASPIMADEPEEAAKLTGLSDGLVVNIGTLNQHSINAMKSIGCTQEGILRNNYIRPDGTLRSSVIFSVLQNEWNNHIKNHLAKKC